MQQQVKLYIRIALPGGKWSYTKPVFTHNRKIRPQYAIVNGESECHTEGVYYLRYASGSRRVWERVGKDASLALVRLQQRNHVLQAEELGLGVPAGIEPVPEPEVQSLKRSLKETAAEYLAEVEEHKAPTTFAAYRNTVDRFVEKYPDANLEQISRKDILDFLHLLRSEGRSQRSLANNVCYLKVFFRHFSVEWPMLKTDKVKYTEKEVCAYNTEEVRCLLAVADHEESDLLQFFLCTGARDLEVVYATWRDIDFSVKTFQISEKVDFGWKPKDGEEGTIPIPDSLVSLLLERRRRYPSTRLIFPADKGGPNLHLLRTVKSLALRAGLNCGFCHNTAGQCCAKHPICDRFGLHKFRKTFATMHHEAGVPVRTIQRWLRHSDLETTLRYLAGSDDKSVIMRTKVNATFAAFDSIRGAA